MVVIYQHGAFQRNVDPALWSKDPLGFVLHYNRICKGRAGLVAVLHS